MARQRSHSMPDADDTSIKHIPMGHFLSHERMTVDLSEYLAAAVLKKNANSQKLFITSVAGHTRSNQNMHSLDTNHEEADTLMICLAAKVVFFSPDTDVLVLAVAHYDKLCKNTGISVVSGSLEIGPIWSVLGREKAAALHV